MSNLAIISGKISWKKNRGRLVDWPFLVVGGNVMDFFGLGEEVMIDVR